MISSSPLLSRKRNGPEQKQGPALKPLSTTSLSLGTPPQETPIFRVQEVMLDPSKHSKASLRPPTGLWSPVLHFSRYRSPRPSVSEPPPSKENSISHLHSTPPRNSVNLGLTPILSHQIPHSAVSNPSLHCSTNSPVPLSVSPPLTVFSRSKKGTWPHLLSRMIRLTNTPPQNI